jgi:cell division protein ZapE
MNAKIALDTQQQKIFNDLLKLKITLETKENFINKILSCFVKKVPKKVGFYIYGKVGTGKTTVMNQFYEDVSIRKKAKFHFHKFMQQIHETMHIVSSAKDPLKIIARDLSQKYHLICLDELVIDNIADAMIVGRLFEHLCNFGLYLIITSNFHPNDLYKNGLQRENFLKFIYIIIDKFEIEALDSSDDYRRHNILNEKVLLYPINQENNDILTTLFYKLTNREKIQNLTLNLQNRKISFASASSHILFTNFEELCERYLWTLEYLEIAKRFHIIFILNIPKFNENNRNEAKRFIALIDILYENKIILFASIEDQIGSLFEGNPNFARTESRLIEMQSMSYLKENSL